MRPLLDIALPGAQLLLSVALALAGATKLLDRPSFRRTLGQLGVTPALGSLLVVGVPLAEIAIAVALFNETTAVAAGAGAFLLLATFTVVLGRVVARGDQLECRCFGQLSARTVGRATIARNAFLLVLAAIVTSGALVRPVEWSVALTAVQRVTPPLATVALFVTTAIALVALVLVALLLRQHARMLTRLDALEARPAPGPVRQAVLRAGDKAPAFALRNTLGVTRSLADLTEGTPLLGLLFMDADCDACTKLLPNISRWLQRSGTTIRLTIVFNGDSGKVSEKLWNTPLSEAPLLEHGREVSDRYQVTATPTLVIVRHDGTIAMRAAVGGVSIQRLMQALLASESGDGAMASMPLPVRGDVAYSVAGSA